MEKGSGDFIIKGNIVLPDRVAYNGGVLVENGRISAVLEEDSSLWGKQGAYPDTVMDEAGRFVLPGCVDAHVHCFSSLEEGFVHAGNAAAAGGVTTMVEMPYDASGMICTAQLFADKKQRLEREAVVDTALLATIRKKDGLEEIPLLAEQGACGFKISMFDTNPVRFPRIDDGEMLEAFAAVAETGLTIGIHAENDEIVRSHIAKYRGKGTEYPKAHCMSRPPVAESAAVLTALELAYWTGVRLHLYHCSFPRVIDLVDWYRSQGLEVTAETCPHYLVYHEEDMAELKGRGKINPPLRSPSDVEGLWRQIRLGKVDILTSDHAPWLLDKKSHEDIFDNASGAPGVETLLPVLYSEGVSAGRITVLELARLLAENPARIFGLDHCKGRIAPGMDADFAVIDPGQSVLLEEKALHSSAGWSPYHGKRLQGRLIKTYLRGRLIYDGDLVGKPGDGRFIRPSAK